MLVLSLIGYFQSNQQIAMKLGIAERTVATHRNNIMVKLNVHSGADLIKFSLEHGLARLTTLREGRPVLP